MSGAFLYVTNRFPSILYLLVSYMLHANNKFITQREKLEAVIAKVRVFVSNISSPPLSDIKDMGFRMFLSVMHVGGLHVFNKNLKVYIYM